MPNRILRESCRTSPTLAELSAAEERLFWRLVTTADDFGRFQGEPSVVAAACFPRLLEQWPPSRCAEGLLKLQAVGLVRLYKVGDREYGEFVKAHKYFTRRSKHSKYPACEQMPADARSRSPMRADAPEDRGTRIEEIEESRIEDRGAGGPSDKLSLTGPNGSQNPRDDLTTVLGVLRAVEHGRLTRDDGQARLRAIRAKR